MDCEICGRTLYWCDGHGPAPVHSGAPVVAVEAGS